MNNIFLNPAADMQTPQFRAPLYPSPIPGRDWIGELDSALKNLSPNVIDALSKDTQWSDLNTELGRTIQEELVSLVKAQLNVNPTVLTNARKQLDIIKEIEKKVTQEERQNMSELSDYMKNYSHLTFDEYKKIKSEKV